MAISEVLSLAEQYPTASMLIEPKKLPLHPNLMAHDDLTADITKEIAYAIRKLGGDHLIDTWQRPRAGVTACRRA